MKGNYTGEYRSAAHNICNLKHTVRKNPTGFHNGSNCDYHFIIKQFALTSQGLEWNTRVVIYRNFNLRNDIKSMRNFFKRLYTFAASKKF